MTRTILEGPTLQVDQLLWFGLSHREFTYGRLTLEGPPTVVKPLVIVEAKPDSTTGDLLVRWEGGAGPQFQLQAASLVTGPFEPVSPPQSPRTYTDKGVLKSGAARFYRVQEGSG